VSPGIVGGAIAVSPGIDGGMPVVVSTIIRVSSGDIDGSGLPYVPSGDPAV
jgi:hypothetical protein